MAKRYDLREINNYAKDLPDLRFVLESDHDDSIAAIKSVKEKLTDLIISAGFELITLQKRHDKMVVSLQYLVDNFQTISQEPIREILKQDGVARDSVDTEQEDVRG